jgi:SlyX protein
MQHQIDDLQSQLAFQEHTIESLNQALSSQQQQIAEMEHQLQFLIDKVKGMQQSNIANASEETPPPHY